MASLWDLQKRLTVSVKGESNAALRPLEDNFSFGRYTRNTLDDLVDQIDVRKFVRLQNPGNLRY